MWLCFFTGLLLRVIAWLFSFSRTRTRRIRQPLRHMVAKYWTWELYVNNARPQRTFLLWGPDPLGRLRIMTRFTQNCCRARREPSIGVLQGNLPCIKKFLLNTEWSTSPKEHWWRCYEIKISDVAPLYLRHPDSPEKTWGIFVTCRKGLDNHWEFSRYAQPSRSRLALVCFLRASSSKLEAL